MRNVVRRVLIIAALGATTSCSVFGPVKSDPGNIYILNATPAPIYKKADRQIDIVVSQPVANSIYSTSQMAYSTKAYEIAYYSKNSWAQPPAVMLQPLIIESLHNTHYFHSVSPTMQAMSYNYTLNTQLIELKQYFYCNMSFVRVKLQAQLINTVTNEVVAIKVFTAEENVTCRTPYSGVVAANKAVANVLQQLTRFCLNNAT